MRKPQGRQLQHLEFQCDRIEVVLSHNRIAARVTGGLIGPTWQSFRLAIKVGERIDKIRALTKEIALALNTSHALLVQDAQGLRIETPRPDPEVISLAKMLHKLDQQSDELPQSVMVLGLAHDGFPLLVKLGAPNAAHVMVAGTTGAGKSVMVAAMVLSLAWFNDPADAAVVLCDPKGVLGALAALPHVITVATEPEEITQVLNWSVAQMLARGGQAGQPTIVVVIDEMADLIMAGQSEVADAITRLTQRGRQAGIHVIAATQKPTVAAVGSLAKSNFPLRVVGRVTSPEDAKTATGIAASGAHRLQGSGEFLVVTGGKAMTCSGAFSSPREWSNLARAAATRWAGHGHDLRITPVAPDPEVPDPKLAEYCSLAKSAWLEYRTDQGLARGGAIAMARAIFGADAHGQGSQFRWVERVAAALERQGQIQTATRGEAGSPLNEDGEECKLASPQDLNDNVIITRKPALLRCKNTGKVARRWVIIMFDPW